MSTMEVCLEVPHKTENNLSFDPVVPFWDITDSKHRDSCTSESTAALLTTVKQWKQPIHASAYLEINKMWLTYRQNFISFN